MAADLTLVLNNQLTAIANTLSQIEGFMHAQQMPAMIVPSVLLGLEETLVNIVTHGYGDREPHMIMLTARLTDNELRVEITDDGVPFDPTAVPPPDLSQPAEQRPIGGLGVWLTRQMMDEVSYRRETGKNRLMLVKRWGSGSEPSSPRHS